MLVIASAVLLAACGGGSSSSTTLGARPSTTQAGATSTESSSTTSSSAEQATRSTLEGFGPPDYSPGAPTTLPPGIDSLDAAPWPALGAIPCRTPLDPNHVAVWRVETTEKVVALTFDDGPGPFTPLVIAALKKAHVPATFFCIGQHAQEYPSEVSAERAAGFEVENHTWDHRLLTELPYDTIRREITATEAVLGPTTYVRPPAGYYNPIVRDAVASLGMRLIRWDVDTRDWQHQEVPRILAHVQAKVHAGSIILLHDGIMPGGGDTRSETVAAIPLVVAWLRSQGYSFVTVDQLLTGGYGPPATGFDRRGGNVLA